MMGYGAYRLYNANGSLLAERFSSCSEAIRLTDYDKAEFYFNMAHIAPLFTEEHVKIWVDAVNSIYPTFYHGIVNVKETPAENPVDPKLITKYPASFTKAHVNWMKFTIEKPKEDNKKKLNRLLAYSAYCCIRYMFYTYHHYVPMNYVLYMSSKSIVKRDDQGRPQGGIVPFIEAFDKFKLIQLCHFMNAWSAAIPAFGFGLYPILFNCNVKESYANFGKYYKFIQIDTLKEAFAQGKKTINDLFISRGFSNNHLASTLSQIGVNNYVTIKKILDE